ncbi:MAG: plastocyanin/azurin family copper-binding protein [Gemmatimonadaceae bacterium]
MQSNRQVPRRVNSLLGLPLLLMALYACGGGGSGSSPYSTSPGGGGTPPSGNSVSINLQSLAYSPQFDTVSVGSTVTWTNKDAVTHTVTADASTQFNSGDMTAGQTFSQTFTAAGTYPYHCKYHGSAGSGMYGVLVVK